tara:strand:- start:386 stop:1552 length:1167 start_codon:yes stop_codon:yes gene_type:complete
LNIELLNIKVQEYIKKYKEDTAKLIFSGSPFNNIDAKELAQQIESSRKAKDKLPTWYKLKQVVYPPKLNLEQTSSEIAAHYKASLVYGKTLADITGGFGVDSCFFSERFETVHHFEINEELSEIAAFNFKQLGKKNIQCFSEDGLKRATENSYDVIYADPSRRHESKGKVFFLRDCLPNIPENLDPLLDSCSTLMVKTSPMLDISEGLNELKNVFEIHIVAINNEVKELLWLMRKDHQKETLIKTINISKHTSEIFDFYWNREAEVVYGQPERFLYEPNAALMKSGGYNVVSEAFKLKKLHKNTHLYTGSLLREFPGRRFVIEKVVPYSKSDMRTSITFNKANVSTRNFKESVDAIRKKWKIKDGGEIFLFFTTVENDKKVMLICSKL